MLEKSRKDQIFQQYFPNPPGIEQPRGREAGCCYVPSRVVQPVHGQCPFHQLSHQCNGHSEIDNKVDSLFSEIRKMSQEIEAIKAAVQNSNRTPVSLAPGRRRDNVTSVPLSPEILVVESEMMSIPSSTPNKDSSS